MSDWIWHLSRRRFLAGLAIAGTSPLWTPLDALAWRQAAPEFSGENFELAHKLLFDPAATIGSAAPVVHPELRDVIVVGGGIAGLTAAYKLRDRDVLLLEAAAEAGGVSRSEAWQGIEYATGAAYIIDPDPESEDARELAGFELLEELGLRRRGEDLSRDRTAQRRLSGDANHTVFSNRRVIPEAEIYTLRNRRFFEALLDSDAYPSVPPEDAALVEALDRVSFRQFLENAPLQRTIYGRTVGPIPPLGWEAIEYYCWGAFGTTASETSAYHGLNFFAAEFGDVLVYPGGNGFITRRLADRIRQAKADAIRTGAWTLRIERDGAHHAVTTWEDGVIHRRRAGKVIFAAPLFLAPKIIPSLPEAQRAAIASLQYRSYVVANVLLRRPADRIFAHRGFRNGYELTRVHGAEVRGLPAAEISTRKVFSDAILADFAAGRHPSHAVLTVYRPYPYDDGRGDLFERTYEQIEGEIRREVLAGFGPHGVRAEDIEGVRIARWGHPMLIARPGQLADGTIRAASQPQRDLYFAHTDTQGAPAYENALAAAFDAVAACRRVPS
ncbi:MAG TPA: FAD-dependent oxidoreductase [Vicinamibacterales bacterium]|nr:FAD-dependent oxidoreductase [Vicinamibacterales bacterium]